jgi:hypothetical protein
MQLRLCPDYAAKVAELTTKQAVRVGNPKAVFNLVESNFLLDLHQSDKPKYYRVSPPSPSSRPKFCNTCTVCCSPTATARIRSAVWPSWWSRATAGSTSPPTCCANWPLSSAVRRISGFSSANPMWKPFPAYSAGFARSAVSRRPKCRSSPGH